MSVLGGWLLAPVALFALCGGAGLLAERLAGVRLPGAAVPGVGLALVVVVAGVLTIAGGTAVLATPACVLVALAGGVLGRRRLTWSPWPWVVGLGAYALLAWPSLSSGQASVTGYIKLDDSAIWLGLISHLMDHGRGIADVPPSTFQLDLLDWLHNGYPVGSFTPVGVTGKLTGQDYANVYQSVICVYGAIAGLGLFTLAGGRRRGAVCALVAVQASLFFGYAQWGSIKEIAAVALVATLLAVATRGGGRALLLAAVPAGALLDTYGSGGVIWAGPGMVVAVLLAGRLRWRVVFQAAGAAALVAVCAIPAIAVLGTDAKATTKGSPVNQDDIGKLLHAPDLLQGAGLWPAGDFRVFPDPRWPAVALAVVGLLLAGMETGLAVRRRAWTLPAVVAAVLLAALAGLTVGGPWIDAKVLAITSPFLLLATALATRRAAPVVLVIALVSTWLVARDVYVAPRNELTELRSLGHQLAGKGPTLVLNYEGYATRYFLGPAQDEGISDLRYHVLPDRNGHVFPDFTTADIDAVGPAGLSGFRTVVRRTSPVTSRMPSAYRRVHDGRFFEAYRHAGPDPKTHVALGSGLAPGAQLECRQARRIAAGSTFLVAAPVVEPVVVAPVRDAAAVTLPRAGVWRIWVGGGALGRLTVRVDGHAVGTVRHQLDASVGWLRFDPRRLGAGVHRVTLSVDRGWWRGGRGTRTNQLPLGPVALSYVDQPPLVRIPSAQVDRLCDGRDYDWLETF